MFKEITIAVVSAGIVAMGGYIIDVKVNKVIISNLKDELKEIKGIVGKNQESLVATKLFIARAHPNHNPSQLLSFTKLQSFNSNDVKVLAKSLASDHTPENNYFSTPSNNTDLSELIKKYQLNEQDIANYSEVAHMPTPAITIHQSPNS